jgi:hypothetical protein
MSYRNLIGCARVATAFCLASAGGAQAQDLSKYPDWSGQWKSVVNPLLLVNPLQSFAFWFPWDPDKPSGPGQQAPLTPEYQARYEANLADQAAGGQGDERHSYCIPLGMPRLMSFVYPMEIVITPKTAYILSDFGEPRRIFTDGRQWPSEIEPSFNGLSIGKWVDADSNGRYATLEVETRGMKGPRTFEASGIRLHDDNQTVVTERIHLDPSDKNKLLDEITTVDHALTRPWTVIKKYVRDANSSPIWNFNECAENNPLILVGKESYYISGDGFLMPVKKGQQPPDLRYFKSGGK